MKPLSALPCEVVDCHHSTPVWTSDGVVVIRNQNIRNGKLLLIEPSYTDEKHYRERVRRAKPSPGDLVITREAPMGQICMIPDDLKCCLGQRMVLLRIPEGSADRQYIMYAIQAHRLQRYIAVAGGTGSTVSNLRIPLIRSMPIPTPSPAEQRAIATALSDVDALQGGLNRLIAKKRNLKQAAMQQLLTGQTRLPGLREEWESRRLGDVAEILKGRTLSKSHIAASGTRLCILYGELFTTYGRAISEVVSRTSSDDGCRSVLGDVLLPGSTTTTGADLASASALMVEDVALGGDIIVVRRKNDGYDSVFLANYLTHSRSHEIAELTQGITIHHLYGKDLKSLSLRLPSLPEQIAIATVLSDMSAELVALEARRAKTHDLKRAMMQELLTGKTRLVPAGAAHV